LPPLPPPPPQPAATKPNSKIGAATQRIDLRRFAKLSRHSALANAIAIQPNGCKRIGPTGRVRGATTEPAVVPTVSVEFAVGEFTVKLTAVRLKLHVGGAVIVVGETLHVRLAFPVKPFVAVTVTVEVPDCPGVAIVIADGLAETDNAATVLDPK